MSDPVEAVPVAGPSQQSLPLRHASPRLALAVGLYLVVVVCLSIYTLIAIFPEVNMRPLTPAQASATNAGHKWEALVSLEFNPLKVFGLEVMKQLEPAQGLLFMAFLAGILGSFMHAGQSFAKYVGNEQLTSSWACWYILRPPVGGVLGLLFYFVLRAGLLSASVDAVSPYGVVAFGALAGWFSKQATDKLAEVFENLFRTEKTGETRDKLSASALLITKVTLPAPLPSAPMSRSFSSSEDSTREMDSPLS